MSLCHYWKVGDLLISDPTMTRVNAIARQAISWTKHKARSRVVPDSSLCCTGL